MDWGDASSWAALPVAIAAAGISVRALRYSKDSAEAARRSALAAERSATAEEASLADARREANERRAAEAEAARPKPELQVEAAPATPGMGVRNRAQRYILRNVGTGAAENVTVVSPGEPRQFERLPVGITLDPGDGHEFRALRAAGIDAQTAIRVSWDGQGEPVALPLPQ
ncbi:hypothetical protein [Streptomyces sp. NE5-10]|uniref:hypothetical protein n=1 Tax=Streptomyces sp. NE5-10 TaxID=2759674 RepID=UPI0019061CCD|nr:hypothetical protein [Streptomyces sp. NE5-10]